MLVNVMDQDHVHVYIGYYDNGLNPYVFAYWMIPWEKPKHQWLTTTCVYMLVKPW